MLDQIKIQFDCLIAQALQEISGECFRREDGSGHMAQAAVESQEMAKSLNGAVLHVNVSAADLVCAAADALRRNQRQDLVERLDAIIHLIKGAQARRIIGQSFMGVGVQQILEVAGQKGANLVGIEDPRSGDVVPIGKAIGGS